MVSTTISWHEAPKTLGVSRVCLLCASEMTSVGTPGQLQDGAVHQRTRLAEPTSPPSMGGAEALKAEMITQPG